MEASEISTTVSRSEAKSTNLDMFEGRNTQEDASSADRSMTFGRTYTVYDSTTCNPHVSHFKFGVDANARIDE